MSAVRKSGSTLRPASLFSSAARCRASLASSKTFFACDFRGSRASRLVAIATKGEPGGKWGRELSG